MHTVVTLVDGVSVGPSGGGAGGVVLVLKQMRKYVKN